MLLFSGCGYTLAARNSVIKPGQTVDVRMFANRTTESNVDGELRLAFVNELAKRGVAVSGDRAAYVFSGEIASLGVSASAFSGVDGAMLYRLVLLVQAQLSDSRSGEVVWKGEETVRQEYPVNSDLALQRNAYDAAVAALCRQAARLLVAKMHQSF